MCDWWHVHIFHFTFSLLFLSLTHETHEQTLFRAHTTHKHTNTQTHYIYLYISLTLSVSISLFIILILFLFFFFFHLFFYRSFTYLPSVFRFFVAAFSYDFISRTIFRSLYFDAFVFFFFPFFSFSLLLLLSLSFVITRTTNERFATDRLNSRQSIYYVILRFRSKDIHPVCVIYSFRENIACTFTFIPVHLCFVAASSIQTDPSPHK